VGQAFPELGQVFKELTGQTAQAMLQHHAAAHQVRQLSLKQFLVGVRVDFEGCRLYRALTRIGAEIGHREISCRLF
jgi:hypothetical protein